MTDADSDRLAKALTDGVDPSAVALGLPWAAGVRRANGEVVLATSAMWASGLFWCVSAGSVIWATDPGAVVRERADTRLDEGWILECLAGQPSDVRTPYTDVHRLPAGCVVVIGPSGSEGPIRQWVSHDWAGPQWSDVGNVGDRAPVQAYREAFATAATALAERAGPVTVSLSGGIDSTYLAAVLMDAGVPVHGCVSSPIPGAPLLRAPGRVYDDLPWAQALADEYPGRLTIEPIRNEALVAPLDAAESASRASWWPCSAVDNMVWISQIRRAALERGSAALFVGSHGNWSFSPDFALPEARRSLTARFSAAVARRRRAPAQLSAPDDSPVQLRGRGPAAPRWDSTTEQPQAPREQFLSRLARRGATFAPLQSPAALGGRLWIADPFASTGVLNMAARITLAQWQSEPRPRGFARLVAQGKVPDSIRLRTARGAQAPDAWAWIMKDRARYVDELDLLSSTPVVEAAVDVDHLRAAVLGWNWGTNDAPRMVDLIAVHRVLALGGFVRLTLERLARETWPTAGGAPQSSGARPVPRETTD